MEEHHGKLIYMLALHYMCYTGLKKEAREIDLVSLPFSLLQTNLKTFEHAPKGPSKGPRSQS